MNKQDAFTLAAAFAFSDKCLQNDVATGNSEYRSLNGKRSIIGHFITDELYEPDMEQYSIYGLFNYFHGIPELFALDDVSSQEETLSFWSELGRIDSYYDFDGWDQLFHDIANNHNLVYQQ